MVVSTFSGLTMAEVQKAERRIVNGEVFHFKYTKVIADHYRYRGAVDNHNSFRRDYVIKSQIGLKSAWVTIWWPV